MTTENFDAIFTALKDLLKYQIINHTNTGDKTLDNLINTMCLSILTAVFAAFSIKGILFYIALNYRKTTDIKLDDTTKQYYKTYIADHKCEFTAITWYINDTEGKLLANKLGYYYAVKKYGVIWDNPQLFDTITHKIGDNTSSINYFDYMKKHMGRNEPVPIYLQKNGLIAVVRNDKDNLVILYNKIDTFNAFMKEITNIILNKTGNATSGVIGKSLDRPLQILSHKDDIFIGNIYPDRNFNTFVSRHKGKIFTLINAFERANGIRSGSHPLNIYKSYNLGFIMQGDPGTGKTLFIKAICNYFKRDACIVDMRNIKTKEDFANCFSEHEKYVYVLDEFDFVQDIIRDRSMDISGTDEHKCKSTSRLQELRERQLQIMGLISNSTESLHSDKGDKKQKPPLLQELENINTEIKEVQNALSLDTILTTLDGITEMRGRIMIAATNHIDKIDPALLRDGRFDYKFHLTKFNSAEVCDMLCIMFPDEVEKIQSHSYKEDKYTPVQLISLFNAHQDLNKMIEELTVS